MKGWDKQSVRLLEELGEIEGLSEYHVGIVASLREWYHNPEMHFFTGAQRKTIKDIHDFYRSPLKAPELRLQRQASEILESPGAREYEKDKVRSILSRDGGNPRNWPRWFAGFIRDTLDAIATRAKQKTVRDRLEAMLAAGEVRHGAENFCESIISWFDEKGQWTEAQMEHAEKIVAGNADPEDGEEDRD